MLPSYIFLQLEGTIYEWIGYYYTYRGPLKIELSSNNNNLAIESETGQCHDFSNDALNKVAMFHAVKYWV